MCVCSEVRTEDECVDGVNLLNFDGSDVLFSSSCVMKDSPILYWHDTHVFELTSTLKGKSHIQTLMSHLHLEKGIKLFHSIYGNSVKHTEKGRAGAAYWYLFNTENTKQAEVKSREAVRYKQTNL